MNTPDHPSYPTKKQEELFRAILELKSEDEATDFFRDLLTIAELAEFANRWAIVGMLRQGSSYAVIAEKLGVSTATVTRVAQWLHHGRGGYTLIADRMKL